MKSNTLLILFFMLLQSGCVSDIAKILNNINMENSGYLYIYTAPAIQTEINRHQKVLDSLDRETHLDLFRELNDHKQRTLEIAQPLLAETGGETMLVVKRPPRPCPPPSNCFEEIGFISYFTVNPEDWVKIFLDGREIKVINLAYDDLTQIKTVKLPEKLSYKDGSVINIKLTVSYFDSGHNVKTDELDWKIPASR